MEARNKNFLIILTHVYEVLKQKNPMMKKKSEQGFASGLGVGINWEKVGGELLDRDVGHTNISICQNYIACIYFNNGNSLIYK